MNEQHNDSKQSLNRSDNISRQNSDHGGKAENSRRKSRQAGSRSSTQLDMLDTPDYRIPLSSSRQEKGAGTKTPLTSSRQGNSNMRSSTVNDLRPATNQGVDSRVEEEEEEIVLTIEDKRQEIVKKHYHEVRLRARDFVAKRQARLNSLQEAGSNEAKCESSMETEQRLPTIEESKDEIRSKQSAKSNMRSNPTDEDTPLESPNLVVGDDTNESQPTPADINRVEEVAEMEKEAESGIVMDDDEEDDEDPELSPIEKQAMHEAVMEGNLDLLDDLLDLPGANMDILWFGENLLMTAIRAEQTEMATFLIDNGVDVNFKTARFEKREDMQAEIDIKTAAALELEREEQKNKKKTKKKMKDKDKEKLALEQLEKEQEEAAQILTPELNPARALTDMDMFMVSCRDMAVETDQADILEMIEEKNGQSWPSSFKISRKIMLKRDIQEKLIIREDWIHSEEESEEEFNETPINTDRSKSRQVESVIDKGKRSSTMEKSDSRINNSLIGKESRSKTSRMETSQSRNQNSVMDNSKLQGKSVSRNQKDDSHLSNKENVKVTASREKFGGNITVAGNSEVPSPSPLPPSPVEEICHCPDEGPTETRIPYRTTRTFLTRKIMNEKIKDLHSQTTRTMNRQFVKSHGSFMSESQAWEPKISRSLSTPTVSKSNVGKGKTRKRSDKGYINIVDSYNDQSRFQNLRPSITRKMSPWAEDDPDVLTNFMKRSTSQITVQSVRANKSKDLREIEARKTLLRSQSNPAIRTNSSLYDGTRSASKIRTAPSTAKAKKEPSKPRKLNTSPTVLFTRSSTSLESKQKSSYITQCRGTILFSPPKPTRLLKTSQSQSLLSLLDQTNNQKHKNTPNAWSQKFINKQVKAKRYSPAGYLKGGHTKEELEHLNIVTLQQQKKQMQHHPLINSIG